MARTRRFCIAMALFTLISAAIRLPGMFNDFSLDEIWSLNFAREAGSFTGIFKLHHDNNHWLNTIYLRALGDQPHWYWYRMLALITGVACVPLAGWIARRHFNAAAGIIAMILLSLSYLFVHYSSEARGYAPATCFALIAFVLLDLWIDRPDWKLCAAFWLAIVLGVLSHQMFAFAYAGLVSGSILAVVSRQRIATAIGRLVALHAVPAGFISWLYFHDIRGQTVGGASAQNLAGALVDLLRWCTGVPMISPAVFPAMMIVAIISAALLLAGLYSLLRRNPRDHAWLTIFVACALAPALLLMSPVKPMFPSAKLFQISAAFALIVISGAISIIWNRRQIVAKICAGAIVVAFVAGNIVHLARFYRDGRGHFLQALNFVVDHTPQDEIPIVGSQRWRTVMLLRFYQRYLPAGKHVYYPSDESASINPPLWAMLHDDEQAPNVPTQTIRSPNTGQYFERVAEYPYYGLDGFNWYVYQYRPGR